MNLFGASATERCVLTARPFPTKDLTIPENALFVTRQGKSIAKNREKNLLFHFQ